MKYGFALPATRTQATKADIDHLSLKLCDPSEVDTAKADTKVNQPIGTMVTAVFTWRIPATTASARSNGRSVKPSGLP